MKRKHAELIKKWADGADIQIWNGDAWEYQVHPLFFDNYEYREEPKPKPDVVVYSRVVGKFLIGCENIEINQLILRPETDRPNIKYTFDGEWGNLKSAEVI
jgi:hypothetical protein